MSVYFIACGGFIKVGYSEDVDSRVANLFDSSSRYAAPRAAYEARGSQVLLGHIEGTKQSERALHRALGDFCAGLEWFVDEPELREYLAGVDGDLEEYPHLVRDGGPVDVEHAERGGGNVALGRQLLTARSASRRRAS